MSALERALGEIGWLPATEHDADFLRLLFFELKSSQLEGLDLPFETLGAVLAQQYAARSFGYAAAFPSAATFIKTGIGSFIVSDGEAIHVVDITISEVARGQGHGTQALTAVLGLGKPVSLNVELHNHARRLYERLGLKEISSDGMHSTMRFP